MQPPKLVETTPDNEQLPKDDNAENTGSNVNTANDVNTIAKALNTADSHVGALDEDENTTDNTVNKGDSIRSATPADNTVESKDEDNSTNLVSDADVTVDTSATQVDAPADDDNDSSVPQEVPV